MIHAQWQPLASILKTGQAPSLVHQPALSAVAVQAQGCQVHSGRG